VSEVASLQAELAAAIASKNQYFELAAQYARELKTLRDGLDAALAALRVLEDLSRC